MAVSSRKVQNKRDSNGVLTGKAGTVYDVNIKYTGQDGKKKSYAKKGFATKKEATQHEAEMKAKLANPVYSPVVASQGKQTVKELVGQGKGVTNIEVTDSSIKAFELVRLGEDDVKAKFPAMYNAFCYGAPPHAGIAPGVDRMVMLLAGEDSIREIIPFPMNKNAQDIMMGAPSTVEQKQLDELHIAIVGDVEKDD